MRKKFSEVDRELMKVMAKNLKDVLDRKGKSQKDLAEITGLSTSAISDYINAKTLMSPGNVQIVSSALKVSKSEIDPTFRGTMTDEKNSESQLSNKEFMKLAIEDLSTHELTYKGQKLTEEQKAHMLKLIETAADMMTD